MSSSSSDEPAGQQAQQQAMTTDRLAEIRAHIEMAYQVWMADDMARALMRDYPDLPHDFAVYGEDLLAEVERQRAALVAAGARAAAARPIVAAVLWDQDYTERSVLLTMREQARAWLASADEQAAPGEA